MADEYGFGNSSSASWRKPPVDRSQLNPAELEKSGLKDALGKASPEAVQQLADQAQPDLSKLSLTNPDWYKGVGGKLGEQLAGLPSNLLQAGGRLLYHSPEAVKMWMTDPRLAADLMGHGIYDFGKSIVDSYVKLVTDPKAALEEDPLGQAMNVAMIAPLGGRAISGAARVAEGAGAAEGIVNSVDRIAQYTHSLKYLDPVQSTFELTNKLMRMTPGLRSIPEAFDLGNLDGAKLREGVREWGKIGPETSKLVDGMDDAELRQTVAAVQSEVRGSAIDTGASDQLAEKTRIAREAGLKTLENDRAALEAEGRSFAIEPSEKAAMADRLKDPEKYLKVAEQAATKEHLATIEKAHIVTPENLTDKGKRLYDEMVRVGRAEAKAQIAKGAQPEFFENAKLRNFAQSLGLPTNGQRLAGSLKMAKETADRLGIDLEYYPHIFPRSAARERLVDLIGEPGAEGSAPAVGDVFDEAQLIDRPKTAPGFKEREGGNRYLGSDLGEAAKAADKEWAQKAFDKAKAALPKAKGPEVERLNAVMDASESVLTEIEKRTRGFDIAMAFEIKTRMHSSFMAMADFLDKFGKKFGRLWDGVERPDPAKYRIVDVDGYVHNASFMINGYNAGLARLVKGGSLDEAVIDIASETAEGVIKAQAEKGATGIAHVAGRQYVVPVRNYNALMQDLASNKLMNQFAPLKALDSVKQFMGITSLGLTPRWQVNNVVGNFVMTAMAIKDPYNFVRALGKRFKDLAPSELIQKTQWDVETSGSMLKAARETIANARGPWYKKLLKPIVKTADAMHDMNQKVDAYFRTVTYLDEATAIAKRENMVRFGEGLQELESAIKNVGMSDELAAETIDRVNRILPDYTSLSPFERMYMRRIIPFYSFNRQMALIGLRFPVEHPMRTKLLSMSQGLWYDASSDPFVPDYMKATVPIGVDEDGNPTVLNLTGMNPFGMLQQIVESTAHGNSLGIIKEFAGITNPIIQVAIESVSGRDSFTNKSASGPFVTFDGKMLVRNKDGKIVEEVPPIDVMAKFERLIPHLAVLQAAFRSKEYARPYANTATGKVLEPFGGEVGREMLKLGGFNFRVIDQAAAQKAVDMLRKQYNKMVVVNGVNTLAPDDDHAGAVVAAVLRANAKPRKGRGSSSEYGY